MRFLTLRDQVVGVLDNDESKRGGHIAGIAVTTPDNLSQFHFDKVLVASMHALAIYEQLLRLGIEESKIEIVDQEILNAA